jgi:hypothetical protein
LKSKIDYNVLFLNIIIVTDIKELFK